MQDGETCTVKIIDNRKNVITKVYTSADVDSIDKTITVTLSKAETASMAIGRGTLTAYFNDLVSIPPTEFYVKEAL